MRERDETAGETDNPHRISPASGSLAHSSPLSPNAPLERKCDESVLINVSLMRAQQRDRGRGVRGTDLVLVRVNVVQCVSGPLLHHTVEVL